MTLTVKSIPGAPLAERLDHLYTAFQALRRRKLWQRRVTGGVAMTEIKWTKKDAWHPHLHCIIEGSWIDVRKLKAVWYALTGDSYIIDIRKPPSVKHVVGYVTKYASKPYNNSFINRPGELDEAVQALTGRKLAITFGRWRGVLLTKTDSKEGWEFVAPLDQLLSQAAHGDVEARCICDSLTDVDLTPIYGRAPPPKPPTKSMPEPDLQTDFMGVFDANGSFRARRD